MGPKLFQLPILLVLAYLGIGYVSWILAVLILGYRGAPLTGTRPLTLALLSSFIMLAWDLSMEADWSTIDRAWIWRRGGAYFGVPVSNFFGWYLTSFLFYLAFSLYLKARRLRSGPASRSFWRSAIFIYAICAGGNLLIERMPMAPAVVFDPTGIAWATQGILAVGALISTLVMGPMAAIAWLRLNEQLSQL